MLTLFSFTRAFALKPHIQQLIHFETLCNDPRGDNDYLGSEEPIALENYEIPLSVLGPGNISDRMSEAIRNSLIFIKGGREYVRWIINPNDQSFYLELEDFLRSKRVSIKRQKYFTGYMLASRSIIVEDEKTDTVFSLKVSTDNVAGIWRNKRFPIESAMRARLISDHIFDVNQQRRMKNVAILDEVAMFGISEINQAMGVRSLEALEDGNFYLPGFSAIHEETGQEIARLGRSRNPTRFWDIAYNQAWGRASGELAAAAGVTYESNHSQQPLIEFDKNWKATGRIIMRDPGDTFLYVPYFKNLGKRGRDLLKQWDPHFVSNNIVVAADMFHGTRIPRWINFGPDFFKGFRKWGENFFSAFEAEFENNTGLKLSAPLQSRQEQFAKVYGEPGSWATFQPNRKSPGSLRRTPRACMRSLRRS